MVVSIGGLGLETGLGGSVLILGFYAVVGGGDGWLGCGLTGYEIGTTGYVGSPVGNIKGPVGSQVGATGNGSGLGGKVIGFGGYCCCYTYRN